MKRTTVAAVLTLLGSVVVAALVYAAVVSVTWVFVVMPVVPAALLASLGLGATILTRGTRAPQSYGLVVLGALLCVAGAATTIAHFALWGLQFEYVDAGRDVPATMARGDDITFVGSALICAASMSMATAVLARAWSRPSGVPGVSTNVTLRA